MNTILPVFFLLNGFVGFGLSVSLVYFQKLLLKNLYLSICIFSLSICSVYNFCYVSGVLNHVPLFLIIAKSSTFLVAPCAYLYIRNIFNPANRFKHYDWINFIPFVIMLVAFINVSLLNPRAVSKALADSSLSWLVHNSYTQLYHNLLYVKCTVWLFYTFLQSRCIYNFEKQKHPASANYNHSLLNWVKVFNIILIFLFSIVVLQLLVKVNYARQNFENDTMMAFVLTFTICILLSNPKSFFDINNAQLLPVHEPQYIPLYRTSILDQPNNNRADEKREKDNSNIKPLFSKKKKDEYLLILNEVIITQKPFLNKKITVKKMADITGIPGYHLSNLIGKEFNLQFQDFINMHRITYLKAHIDNAAWTHLTLEGIGQEVGFGSRTTFFRAFIKFTGLPPSEYFNSIKKGASQAS